MPSFRVGSHQAVMDINRRVQEMWSRRFASADVSDRAEASSDIAGSITARTNETKDSQDRKEIAGMI